MYTSTILLFVATAFSGVSAQNYSTSGPLNVTASQIDPTLRDAWCRGQQNTCPLLCNGDWAQNGCDAQSLSWTCTCTSGNTPNVSDYDQTMPSFVCAQWKANCVNNHPNDRPAISACQSVVCGSKNASAASGGSGSGSASSSSAASASSSAATSGAGSATTSPGSASATAASTTSSAPARTGAAVALSLAQNYGTGALAAGFLAVFGLAL